MVIGSDLIPANDPQFDAILGLLREIESAGEHYVSAALGAENYLLNRLCLEGFIHWCPYPEEFYILYPKGKKQLEHARRIRANGSPR